MLNYRRFGQGPTLVLQHGFLGGSAYFVPQMAYLGRYFDVIAADLPGFAGSCNEEIPRSIEDLSDSLMHLLDDLQVDKFSLLGHSMGGMVALQTALNHSDRINKLILYATSSSGHLPGRFETFEETCQRVEARGVEAIAADVTATWFVDEHKAPFYPFAIQAGQGASKDAVIACLKAIPQWEVTNRLNEIKMPTLVIGADKDRSYYIEGIVQLAASISNAELCMLPGCAHNAHLDKTDLFNQIVGDFLMSTTI